MFSFVLRSIFSMFSPPLSLSLLPLSPSILSSYSSFFLRQNPAHNPSRPQTHEQPLLWLPMYWDNRCVPLCLVFFSLLPSCSFLGFWNIYMKESKYRCIYSEPRGIMNKIFCSWCFYISFHFNNIPCDTVEKYVQIYKNKIWKTMRLKSYTTIIQKVNDRVTVSEFLGS